MNVSRGSKIGLRTIALVYLFVLLVVPIGVILTRTFENGIGPFLESITTPAAISALNLSLIIVAIVVPINVVFGVVTALALVRGRFPGRGVLQSVVDLPFAVSPVVVGVSLILLWGANGWFGGIESLGFKVIFGLPGMVIATIFRDAALRRPGSRTRTSRDRRRAGTSSRDARCLGLADVLADHLARDPLGLDIRNRVDGGAFAR